MRRIIIVESVTLDGVMQAPGAPDEDVRDGFTHGGWALPYNDPVMRAEMGKGMGGGDLLLGRRTYEQLYAFWPKQTDANPFTKVLNDTRKYVASTTLTEPLPWVNSTLLEGDAADAVARLKEETGNDIVVLGSGELVQTLMRQGLVDEYTLLIHPLVLGEGRRLFRDRNSSTALRLTHSVVTSTGVVMATYQPDGAAAPA